MKRTFTPRISFRTQYDDNINLVHEDEDSDWISTVSPGLSLGLESPQKRISLDYEAGFSSYRDDSSKDSTRHQGTGLWEQRLSRHINFELRDIFVRSEDPILVPMEYDPNEGFIERIGQIEEVYRERRIYHRNNGQISLSWQFDAESRMNLGYRIRYLDSKSSSLEGSMGHEGFLDLDTRFSPRIGMGFTSRINRGTFEQPEEFVGDATEDFYQHEGGLSLNYNWHKHRRLYLRYSFLYQDFDEPAIDANTDDFRVHQGALGINLMLSPRSEFSIEAGYLFYDFLNGRKRDGTTFDAGLSIQRKRGSVRIGGSSGYDQDYFSSENLGSLRFHQTFGSADYLLAKDLRIYASASYRWEEFFGERDRKDEVWRISAGYSYSFRRWLTLSIDGTHSELGARGSTDPSIEFKDNRIMIRFTGAYPVSF